MCKERHFNQKFRSKMPVKPPQAPPGSLEAPGSSRASILQWVRNRNNQAELYLKNILDFHHRQYVLSIIRLEEERLDWHAFLKKLKECNSDDLSEFAGLVADRLKLMDNDDDPGKLTRKRTRFRDLFTDEELAGIKIEPEDGAKLMRRSSTMPDIFAPSRRGSNISLMERFHSDTQIYRKRSMNKVDEEAEEYGSALHLPSLAKPKEDMTDRLAGKSEAFKTLRSGSLKSQSLPNLAPRQANCPSIANTSHQADNHDNREQGHSNKTANNVVDISIAVPDIKAKKRKRKLKKQVSLSDRIGEFYKKLDDFETSDQHTASESDYFLPPLQE